MLGFLALNTICLSIYRQLDYVAYGLHRSFLLTCCEEGAGGLAGLLVFPLIYLAAVRFPLLSPRWRFYLPVHLAALCTISLLHTTFIAGIRALLFPPLGFGKESYGYLPVRYPMEFAHLFIYYWVTLGFIYLFHEIRFARERELQQARLERSLVEVQLQNLRLQVEPHFLFNAFNAISAALYENPRSADEMIGRLGELLRQLLKEDRSQEVPLRREIELLELYTRIMEARFEDRLAVQIVVPEDLQQVLVPQLLLQPLVENAIRHGMNDRFEARIKIEAERKGASLQLTVRDYGLGLDDSKPVVFGIGLRNTRERLERLYGTEQSFAIRNATDGKAGAVVGIRLPLHFSAEYGWQPAKQPFVRERPS